MGAPLKSDSESRTTKSESVQGKPTEKEKSTDQFFFQNSLKEKFPHYMLCSQAC